ncbi:MAG TPA: hypothetical protein VMP12_01510 [Candidatus Sulfotelmatobacter sp.]|nr:hypothetical protein [Candidatus Sulfotelmatobacter sp.]
MTKLWQPRTLLAFLVLILPCAAQTSTSSNSGSSGRPSLAESLGWIHRVPRNAVEFNYEMTARVRLVFFWVGKDDVGGGYIRRGIAADNPREEMLQVLFGSDPAKAPRAINRWGAGTEAVWHKEAVGASGGGDDVVSSTFFGFMKSSKGKSVSEMQDELKKEKSGDAHQFTGIVSQVESGHATSLVVPLASKEDYTLHQYPEAEQVMLGMLIGAEKPTRVLENFGGCARAGGFLDAVAQLADDAIRGGGAEATSPKSLCYIYDAQVNTLTLEHVEMIDKLDVKINAARGGTLAETSYEHLVQADFVSAHQATGKRVYFTILLGTQGPLRGVPVQIRYQPNWWFQVVLNLLKQTQAPS